MSETSTRHSQGAGEGETATIAETSGSVEASAPAALPIGELIPGTRYRVLAQIGQGGMGTIYAAEHVDLEKKVALKLLADQFASSQEAVEQFRREARAAAKLGNPYICDVTDFGQTPDGRVFFAMEFLDGRSLANLVEQGGPLPPERAIPILRQIAKALGAAHAKGIIHLDVKPDNAMVIERDGRKDAIKVVDFGLASLITEAQANDRIAGTPEFMAPERIVLQQGYDHRADIYSLGAVAYQLLAGTLPLKGETVMDTLTMQLQRTPEPLSVRAPERAIPAELEALVMQMMGKDPNTRPGSMAVVEAMLCEAQIAAGLTTAWDDLELPAVDETWRERLLERMPSPRGRPKRAIVFGAVAAAVIAAAIAVYFGVFRKPKELVKLVTVEVTKTEEPEAVAALLARADRAARGGLYTKPAGEAAIDFIRQAEATATELKRKSAGAASLRSAYASALALVGNELLKADLRELGIVKFKEALVFLPEDPELQAKAELSADEKAEIVEAARPSPRERRAPAPPKPIDQARALAADVFMAATGGRFSEARHGVKALAKVDADGAAAARLADGLRKRARGAWDGGRKGEAYPLYQLVTELDPGDLEAKRRSEPEAPPPPAPAPPPPPVVAAPPPPPAPAPAPVEPKPSKKKVAAASVAEEEPVDARRDPAGARVAAHAGEEALTRAKLADAEAAFDRALRLDAGNDTAMGGLAAVAFERAHYAEALDYARRAAKLAPKNARYLILLGDSYFKLVRYPEALAAYQKAEALASDSDTVASRLQRVRARLGAPE